MTTPAAVRIAEYHATAFRRVWRGTIGTALLTPFFYLAGMGLGLGQLVNDNVASSAALGGVSYVAFLAPGLLAADVRRTMALCGVTSVDELTTDVVRWRS